VIQLYDHRRFGRAGASVKLLPHALQIADLPPFDILHCEFGTLGLIGHRLRATGVLEGRLITTFRGHDVSRFVRHAGKDVYGPLFASGDFFLTNCDFFRQRLVELGCDPAKIAVQRSGIDCERFAFRLCGRCSPASAASAGRRCCAATSSGYR
jgi:colanic acid/amylovoran biosynthesis glycosyltransferase